MEIQVKSKLEMLPTLHLDARDILIVDEAGMLGTRIMERLTREVESASAKLVLIGDPQQLQAIEAGAPFRALTQTHQYAELNQIRRQTIPWQVQASLDLANGSVDKALDVYQTHDHVHQFKYQYEAKAELINLWSDARTTNLKESQIILAYTRKDVKELNDLAREQKRNDCELGEDVMFSMERGERAFAVNDRVYFLKREDSISVINGTLGTIRAIHEKSGVIAVELDCDEASQKPQIVSVNTEHYKHLEHGYAATVYKAQGVTVDRSYILPSKHYDAHSSYVAMTRHRKSCDVFVSREAFPNHKALIDALNRNRAKDLTMDYTEMDEEFARLRSVIPEREELEKPCFEIRPLGQEEKEKLDVFARKAIASRNLSSYAVEEKVVRPDFHDFKKQFEQKNPGLAQKLCNEIVPRAEREILVNHDVERTKKIDERQLKELKQRQEPARKQKVPMRERELEMER